MSTRGFVTIVIDGQEKTVFNHWDSYPSALGQSVLSWLRDGAVNFPDLLAQRARELEMLPHGTPEQVAAAQAEVDASRAVYDVRCNVARLLEVGVAVNGGEFPLDSLFAEWGYVIDLDSRQFEVYRGFQTAPHARGRFAGREPAQTARTGLSSDTYYPVALVVSWPFSALPSDDQFDEWATRLSEREEEEYALKMEARKRGS